MGLRKSNRTRESDDRQPPTSTLARTATASLTAAKVGAKKLTLLSKRPFLSDASFEQARQQHETEAADALFRGLTTLRGSALKVAQMLGMEMDLLPDVYRQALSKAHYQVPPLNQAVVRRLMIAEFGVPPEELFATFDPVAFAAASLGQVHRARTRDGELVAVKVQYPGIATTLHTDLRLVQQFVRAFGTMAYVTKVLAELEQRFAEEVDYVRERRETTWFAEQSTMPDVVIPPAFEAYSSPRVLTTGLLDGMHLDQWLATGPTQAQRDAAAQRVYDFFMHSLFELRAVHTDPNPGNYLFRDDGTIGVIDFGSVAHFTPEFCHRIASMWRAHLRDDLETVVSLYCEFGLANGDRERVQECCVTTFAPFGEWMRRPFLEEAFDFGAHTDFCTQGAKLFREMLAFEEMNGFTTDTVVFDRTLYGLFRIFAAMRARVRMRNQWIH